MPLIQVFLNAKIIWLKSKVNLKTNLQKSFKWFRNSHMKAINGKLHVMLTSNNVIQININDSLLGNGKKVESFFGNTWTLFAMKSVKNYMSYLEFRNIYLRDCSALPEKCPYSEFFWSKFSPNAGKYRPEKLRIRTLFTQCRMKMKGSFFFQFCYCLLIWICLSKTIINNINKLHEKSLTFVDNDRHLSDCNGTRTHNHLVRKRTLNHLAKLAKWVRCVVSTYLNGSLKNCEYLCTWLMYIYCVVSTYVDGLLKNYCLKINQLTRNMKDETCLIIGEPNQCPKQKTLELSSMAHRKFKT